MTDFESEWARCRPWLEAAMVFAGETHGMDDVKAKIERREARLWAGRAAAAVTEIYEYPKFKALNVWLAGGDLAELRDELRPAAEAYGKEQGCRMIIAPGRQGWARALGYEIACYSSTKELR